MTIGPLILEICPCCKGCFQRLPMGKKGTPRCRFCQEHDARHAIAKHVHATLPGCVGVAAYTSNKSSICRESDWGKAGEYESIGPYGHYAASVARLLACAGWEHSQVRTNEEGQALLFEAVRMRNQVLAVATLGSEIQRRFLNQSVTRFYNDMESVRQKCRLA